MRTLLTTLHALSPLHAGTGQGVGVVDLPIAREKATNLPFLPGSSVKGVLRDACPDQHSRVSIFGPEREQAHEHAGQAIFSDQRLLLLPVRSLAGTFAWVTSPFLLERFARTARDCGLAVSGIPSLGDEGLCCSVDGQESVVLEELNLRPAREALTLGPTLAQQIFGGQPAWAEMLERRLCVVHDDVLDFLLLTATEVRARVSIEPETKIARDGQLWYEELLPSETVLYGLLQIRPVARPAGGADKPLLGEKEVLGALQKLTERTLQFGGKASVGYGLCRLQIGKGGAA
jgi:CRISPR-associated protein Cmr4